MELFFMLLIISIVMGIIGAIRWAVSKKRGIKYEDLKPLEHPLFGYLSTSGKEDGLRWVAERYGKGGNWVLIIHTEKETWYPEYKLSEIPTWEELIVAKNKIVEQIKNLKEGKRWEDIEPPASVMKNKSVKFSGQIVPYTHYEVFNDSGVWELRILKTGFIRTKLIDSAVAETWQEIIQMKDLWVKQEGLQLNRETESRTLKKSELKKLKKLKKL